VEQIAMLRCFDRSTIRIAAALGAAALTAGRAVARTGQTASCPGHAQRVGGECVASPARILGFVLVDEERDT
jgi:hypothetical protein